MPKKPLIETELSEEDRAEFRRLLASGRLSIDALTTWLEAKGYEIGRSSVGRYAKSFERTVAKLRQSREITKALCAELGESAEQGKQGRILVEMTRSMVHDLIEKMQDDPDQVSTKDIMQLGKGLAELGKALRLDQDFEEKIRVRVIAEEREKAAEVAAEVVEKRGASVEEVAFIRAKILGIADRVEAS
jgi:hypothetical protein